MPVKVLYVLVPTWVTSTRDNRRHYVPAHELIRLYRLPPGTYRVVGDAPSVPQAIERAKRAGLIILYPDPTGRYALPGRDDVEVEIPKAKTKTKAKADE